MQEFGGRCVGGRTWRVWPVTPQAHLPPGGGRRGALQTGGCCWDGDAGAASSHTKDVGITPGRPPGPGSAELSTEVSGPSQTKSIPTWPVSSLASLLPLGRFSAFL